MPKFDFDKYDIIFDDDFEPEEADEQDIIDGMKTSGCPFAFMIDQVNQFLQWKRWPLDQWTVT